MLTFQDFQKADSITDFIRHAIHEHMESDVYRTAKLADTYDRQQNDTIYNYVRTIMSASGQSVLDITAANNKLASNFFARLNTQRTAYSLGNGVTFTNAKTKERLGTDFDVALQDAGYKACIHGVSFGFWNYDKLHVFPVTEFCPLWDEDTGALMAGIRWWQLDEKHPVTAVLYEQDGYTKYHTKDDSSGFELVEVEKKRAYKQMYRISEADGIEIVGGENYGDLPIVPFWGNRLHLSTLIGMQRKIDSYDLIQSGFANDLSDVAQIYWIISNAGGMSPDELAAFRDRLLIQHIALADMDNSDVKPYQQEIPYQSRGEYLKMIRESIYEDFGGLDVHQVSADSTNDHLEAAYQPLDENADDFEYQCIKFIRQILALIGIDDTPVFKRNKISNQKEQTEMVVSVAQYLDDETILNKLPWITVDEVPEIMERKAREGMSAYNKGTRSAEEEEEEPEEEV